MTRKAKTKAKTKRDAAQPQNAISPAARELTLEELFGTETAEAIRSRRLSVNTLSARLVVNRAVARDPDAAREVLRDFVGAIEQRSERTWDGPIEWAYARYLADCFARILDGEDATRALNLTRRKGKGTGRAAGKSRTHDKEALGASYWFLRRRGFKPERAVECLSKVTGADRRTIQKAAREDGNAAFQHPQLVDDESLKVAIKPYVAKIQRILAAES